MSADSPVIAIKLSYLRKSGIRRIAHRDQSTSSVNCSLVFFVFREAFQVRHRLCLSVVITIMALNVDSLRVKMAVERAPLLENPWNDEPSPATKARGRRCVKTILHLAILTTLFLAVSCVYLVGLKPSREGPKLSAAERVLVNNPLIGKLPPTSILL